MNPIRLWGIAFGLAIVLSILYFAAFFLLMKLPSLNIVFIDIIIKLFLIPLLVIGGILVFIKKKCGKEIGNNFLGLVGRALLILVIFGILFVFLVGMLA